MKLTKGKKIFLTIWILITIILFSSSIFVKEKNFEVDFSWFKGTVMPAWRIERPKLIIREEFNADVLKTWDWDSNSILTYNAYEICAWRKHLQHPDYYQYMRKQVDTPWFFWFSIKSVIEENGLIIFRPKKEWSIIIMTYGVLLLLLAAWRWY